MTVVLPVTFATLPAVPKPSAALFDQNFNALAAAINALVPANSQTINTQSATTYTVQNTDNAKLLNFTAGSAVAVTLPQATGNFGVGFFFDVINNTSPASIVTITPQGGSTINGSATLAIPASRSVRVVSDGTNYQLSFSFAGIAIAGTENVLNPISTSASSVVAHGMSRAPDWVFCFLTCITANAGYTAADKVFVSASTQVTASGAISVAANATNTYIATDTVLPTLEARGGGGTTTITAANWKISAVPIIFNIGGGF